MAGQRNTPPDPAVEQVEEPERPDTNGGTRNRIVGLEYVEASELGVHPKNWRLHPEEQRAALAGVLEQVGVADAVLAYRSERYGRLTLIDGHLRRELLHGQVPVLILDVNDDEADTMLAAHDVIATMAVPDEQAFQALLDDLETSLPRDVMIALDADFDGPDDDIAMLDPALAKYEIVPQLDEGYNLVAIFCARDSEFAWLQTALDLPTKRDRKRIGTSHVLTCAEFRERWMSRQAE